MFVAKLVLKDRAEPGALASHVRLRQSSCQRMASISKALGLVIHPAPEVIDFTPGGIDHKFRSAPGSRCSPFAIPLDRIRHGDATRNGSVEVGS
jgi:hypothetical protein